MNLPSKELLSEVLGFNVESIELKFKDGVLDLDNLDDVYVCALGDKIYGSDASNVYDRTMTINLYELAHKCKEWCLEQRNIDTVDIEYSDGKVTVEIGGEKNYEGGQSLYVRTDETELEAVFKVCEWILEGVE